MNDSAFSTYNIVGQGTEINNRLTKIEPFSTIKIVDSYCQGFCIVFVDFEICDELPGFLHVNKETNIAKQKKDINSDRTPNSKSNKFSSTPMITRHRAPKKGIMKIVNFKESYSKITILCI